MAHGLTHSLQSRKEKRYGNPKITAKTTEE